MSPRLIEIIRNVVYRSPIYDLWLGRKVPKSIQVPRTDTSRSRKAAWYAEQKRSSDGRGDNTDDPSFRWLAADETSVEILASGLNDQLPSLYSWDPFAWRDDILGERLVRWISAFDILSAQMNEEQQTDWARCILRVARHLDRVTLSKSLSWQHFLIHQARIFAALALPEMTSRMPRYLSALGVEVDRQVLGDGGHIEQSPARALFVLAVLVEIRDALLGHHVQPPEGLISAIDRMIPYLKSLLHGDAGFALFHGTTGHTGDLIAEVISASGSKGRAMTSAPHTGFHRLRAGQTNIIFFCGKSHIQMGNAPATGSFEFSVGKTRIIGNCGAYLGDKETATPWHDALSSTAAYTTLVVQERNMAVVSEASVERREHEGARLIEATHDGYFRDFGIEHRRSVYLDAGGVDIRGEDRLLGNRAAPFCLRFHLYPDVRASMVGGGGEVIIKPSRGKGWRFVTRDPVQLEESVSFHDGRQHRAQQIVILGNHEPSETIVKWRLSVDA